MDILSMDIKEKIKAGLPFYERSLMTGIFSWKELEVILNLAPFLNANRFHIINNKNYEWTKNWWKTDVSAYPTDIVKEEIKKHVCYMQDASRASESINKIAGEIEELTYCPTDAHIFFAFNTAVSEGLGIHNDISSNFIVQVEGETNFKVWDIVAEEDVSNATSMDEEPIIDVVLKSGDVIFIPRKYWHHAISRTPRLSVSFPISTVGDKSFENRSWIKLEDYYE